MAFTEMGPVANLGSRQSGTLTPVVLSTVPEHLSSLSMEGQENSVLAAELQSFERGQERIIMGKMCGSRDT